MQKNEIRSLLQVFKVNLYATTTIITTGEENSSKLVWVWVRIGQINDRTHHRILRGANSPCSPHIPLPLNNWGKERKKGPPYYSPFVYMCMRLPASLLVWPTSLKAKCRLCNMFEMTRKTTKEIKHQTNWKVRHVVNSPRYECGRVRVNVTATCALGLCACVCLGGKCCQPSFNIS